MTDNNDHEKENISNKDNLVLLDELIILKILYKKIG